jgi:hypothetical protein
MEKFGSIDKIVGQVPEDKKQEIAEEFRAKYEDQSRYIENLQGEERPKTAEEEQVINLANELTNDLLRRYGLKPLDVFFENVHVIKQGKWWEDNFDAFYEQFSQAIAVVEQPAAIVFLKRMLHELIHLKSYNAAQVVQNHESKPNNYRVGIDMRSRDYSRRYFKYLNEAIVEQLVMEILEKAKSMPFFAEDLAETEKNRPIYKKETEDEFGGEFHFDDDIYYVGRHRDTWQEQLGRKFGLIKGKPEYLLEGYTYRLEREALNILIDKILQHHPEYTGRQQVFDIFVKAVLQGNMMPLGRLIDNTFGRGTFRRLGEFDDAEKMKHFVSHLR